MKIRKTFTCIISLVFLLIGNLSHTSADNDKIGAEKTLESYINELIEFTRSFDSKDEKAGVVRSYNKGIRFWKVGGMESKLSGTESAFFIIVNRPESFKFSEVKEAGDFAKITVEMNVTGPVPGGNYNGPKTKDVEYKLIKAGQDWKIVSFTDLYKEKVQKERKEKERKAATESEKAKTTIFSTPEELLEQYFTKLKNIFPPGTVTPEKNPIELFNETKHFWANSKKNKRQISNCHSFFNMYSPSTWSFVITDSSQTSASVTVTFVVGNPLWMKMAKGKATKKADCKLIKQGDTWLLNEFTFK